MIRPGCLLLAVLLLVAGCGGGPATHVRTIRSYVALGDSYTSGAGLPPMTDQACYRSRNDYPSLLARRIHVKAIRDASCSGATTFAVVLPQPLISRLPSPPPQLQSVAPGTDLVTIGMGLNNHQVSLRVLVSCLRTSRVDPAICRQFLAMTGDQLRLAAQVVAREVGAAIAQVRARAPHAEVVLVGYPAITLPDASCPRIWPVRPGFPAQVFAMMTALHRALSAQARESGALYADVYTPSLRHGICSSRPWISGAHPTVAAPAPIHPLPAEQQAVARIIAALLPEHA